MSGKEQYAYSLDGELFNGSHDTREEAIEEAASCAGSALGKMWTGRIQKVTINDYANVPGILEFIADNALQKVGDAGWDWLDHVSSRAEEDLKKRIDEWATEYGLQPKFAGIEDVQRVGDGAP